MIFLEPIRISELIGFIIAAAQLGLIWHGLRQMGSASAERADKENNRHEEAMEALKTLIERTAPA